MCFLFILAAAALSGCAFTASGTDAAGKGLAPPLAAPEHSWIPTINVATAKGWPPGTTPVAAPGTMVTVFARGLDHPRWIYVLPNGDVLVAETNGPERPKDMPGLKGVFFRHFQKQAGAGVKSADRITLLRDVDGDGTSDLQTPFLTGLTSPLGMVLVGNDLYVANTDAVVRFSYRADATSVDARGVQVVALPAGPINHHWTKNIVASADGAKLYVAVGSNSNVAENGIAAEEGRAAIWEVELSSGAHRVFASGLRNPVGMAWEPHSGALWVAVNERDELGDDLVPDYMTTVKDGAFYGWPYSYFGGHVDSRVQPQRPTSSRAQPHPTTRSARTPLAGALCRRRTRAVRRFSPRDVRGSARVVEPHPAQRLQGGVRRIRGRPPGRPSCRRADRLSQCARRGDGPAGRCRHGPPRRPACRRRCWQRHLARVRAQAAGGGGRTLTRQ